MIFELVNQIPGLSALKRLSIGLDIGAMQMAFVMLIDCVLMSWWIVSRLVGKSVPSRSKKHRHTNTLPTTENVHFRRTVRKCARTVGADIHI